MEPCVAGRETLRLVRVEARQEGREDRVRHREERVAAGPARVHPATPARPGRRAPARWVVRGALPEAVLQGVVPHDPERVAMLRDVTVYFTVVAYTVYVVRVHRGN